MADLKQKIEDRTAVLGVIGLGYVGLPVGAVFAEAGFPVLGIDVTPEKVEAVNRGESYVQDVPTETLGPLEEHTEVDDEWRAKTAELAAQFLTDEWLFQKRRPRAEREVRIRAGVEVKQKMHKAPGGLIRATTQVQDGVIASVSLSGDFFFFPEEKLADLENALVGVSEADAEAAIVRFYEEHNIESPGVTPADFAQVLG